jgi:hypothetical protein
VVLVVTPKINVFRLLYFRKKVLLESPALGFVPVRRYCTLTLTFTKQRKKMFALTTIAASFTLLTSFANGCNTQEQLDVDLATSYNSHDGLGSVVKNKEELNSSGNLVLLPQTGSPMDPAALDGSPYGFYFAPTKTGSTQWTISIEGGGWCYDEQLCYSRSKTKLGTSTVLPQTAGCTCMNADENGPVTDCNCLYMPYLDGASFSGYREKPWPVPNSTTNETLTFRGIRNIDVTLQWAFKHGLENVTEFVLTGGSAGGLSTFLHIDRVAAQIRARSKTVQKIRAAPVVGYFLDHPNVDGTSGTPNTPSWAKESYTGWMKYIYTMQNLTFGGDEGGLTKACQIKHATEPWLCFMSPHMQDVIQTPFFVFNSKYDEWQINNILKASPWSHNQTRQNAIIQYGVDFLTDFQPIIRNWENLTNGAFITSCICHGCPWSDATALVFNELTPYKAYANWYNDATKGMKNIHIDPRQPNGGGSITNKQCFSFPN